MKLSKYDTIGIKINKIKVLGYSHNDKFGRCIMHCACDCGNKCIVPATHIRTGRVKSCGCLLKQALLLRTKHGHAKYRNMSTTYSVWQGMVKRATDENHAQADRYIKRGIGISKRWLKFINFLADMGERPIGKEIDRIDNNKGYCKQNCRWATKAENNLNKATTRKVIYKGKEYPLLSLCKMYNIRYGCVSYRLTIGWSLHAALTTKSIRDKSR